MSSIGGALGWKSPFPQLKQLPASELRQAQNIVLVVINGMDERFFRETKPPQSCAKTGASQSPQCFPQRLQPHSALFTPDFRRQCTK
ncbi:hypothetical protein AUJ65_03000 [Candidatus Micrarchaeota archaeon CG1_02_51_15]|nr:MAG: hypothetical protein AUJ65_03000 [Candidatus Micrarchaeota archaeon CG1_02_51_15]